MLLLDGIAGRGRERDMLGLVIVAAADGLNSRGGAKGSAGGGRGSFTSSKFWRLHLCRAPSTLTR